MMALGEDLAEDAGRNMAKKIIAVTGATGHVGKVIVAGSANCMPSGPKSKGRPKRESLCEAAE